MSDLDTHAFTVIVLIGLVCRMRIRSCFCRCFYRYYRQKQYSNVCFKKTGTKYSSVLLLRFVPVFLKQTLGKQVFNVHFFSGNPIWTDSVYFWILWSWTPNGTLVDFGRCFHWQILFWIWHGQYESWIRWCCPKIILH